MNTNHVVIGNQTESEGLQALRARVARDLEALAYPDTAWVFDRLEHPAGTLDCAIVGGGQFGQAIAFGLMRERVDRVRVFDRNESGLAGPWLTFARMNMLRTPKHLTGPDLGIGSLTFRAWYEAQHGKAGYKAIHRITRDDWQGYLNWHHDVTGIHVESDSDVVAIDPVPDAGAPLFRLTVVQRGMARHVFARTVVIASGAEGSGQRVVPDIIGKALPPYLHAHSNDSIDFDWLAGKRVGVLGAGASAFDNAATALEAGAAEAHVCFRRPALPRANPRRWMEFAGFLAHYPDLADADKWHYMHRLYSMGQPPPEPTFKRAIELSGFHLQPSTPWDAVSLLPSGAIEVRSGARTLEFDFVIASTGMVVDMSLRPELAAIVPHVALWGERFEPLPEYADERLARFPYLGRCCEFIEKSAGAAPWADHLFTITRGATLSMGPSAASNSNMKYTAPRIVSGVTRALFLDGQADYKRRFDGMGHDELSRQLVSQAMSPQGVAGKQA